MRRSACGAAACAARVGAHEHEGQRVKSRTAGHADLGSRWLCRHEGGASLGLFDVIAIGPHDVRCVQVKSGGKYLSGLEREAIQALTVPANVTREAWRFPDRCRAPLIERL